MPTKPRTVTQAAVFAVAAQLVARGQKPTNAAIRAALGGGSYSSIAPLLKQWHLQQAMGASFGTLPPGSSPDTLHGRALNAIAWLRAEVAALRQQLQQAEAHIHSLERERARVMPPRQGHMAKQLAH